ncbi:MAG: hypothetical protein LBU65_04660 [Planctomycetaceae bacterium]|jgi:hypothetical protein|nr:hypothetical protein [Planctomycetaceae bacterium]
MLLYQEHYNPANNPVPQSIQGNPNNYPINQTTPPSQQGESFGINNTIPQQPFFQNIRRDGRSISGNEYPQQRQVDKKIVQPSVLPDTEKISEISGSVI